LVNQVDTFWELDAWESMFIASEPEENLMKIGEPLTNPEYLVILAKIK
jgi:hypothetical protein